MNRSLIVLIIGLLTTGVALLLLRAGMAGYAAYRRRFTENARTKLEEAFVFYDPNKVFAFSVIGAVVVPPLLWFVTGSFVFAFGALVLAIVMPRIVFAKINKRRRVQIVAQLPDVLLMLSSSLRAGTSLQIALDIAIRETPAPLSQELGVVVREQRLGVALEDALETMAARLKLPEVELVVAAMTIARDVGGNLAETFDRLASTLRAKAQMEGKIRSLTSQGKLQGWIVGLLPVFLMLVLTKMQPDAMAPLYQPWLGWGVLGVIGILELIGFAMIRKIVNIDV
jgi:tight adherence protein B